jgi:nucleotide-binding universal stress UspA family protein
MSAAPGRILVGYDGREPSRDALKLATMLAATDDRRLIIAVVVPGLRPLGGFHRYEEALSARSDRVFAQATKELEALGFERPVEHRALGGQRPAEGLSELARSEDAELIVIGSTHRGPVGRVIAGTTADELIAGADRAFAVAPRWYAASSRDLRLIGVAYDGSAEAKRAAAVAQALAVAASAPLRAFGVREPLTSWIAPGTYVPLGDLEGPIEEELEELLAGLPAGVGGQRIVLSGHPADELLAQGPLAAELMVFGSHGFGRFVRFVAGSVSSKVVRGAPWPVLVVPPHGPLPFGAHDPAELTAKANG